MITISFAKAADLPLVDTLHIQCLGPSFLSSASSKLRAGCSQENMVHLVAHDNGKLVGSIQLWQISLEGIGCVADQKIGYLGPLVTEASYQGKGLGSKLMD